MTITKMVGQSMRDAPFYNGLRKAWHFLGNRTEWNLRRERETFYRQFVEPNDLVFDVGANVGHYSEAFRELRARVVAVEPNPECLRELTRVAQRIDGITVVQAALGAEGGIATMQLGRDHAHGTLSDEHVVRAGDRWAARITVQVLPLCELCHRYGHPDFIKIDVEGYEFEVLSGLREFPRRALSFEYILTSLDKVEACLTLPILNTDGFQFCFVQGEPNVSRQSNWLPKHELLDALRITSVGYGDIIVARLSTTPARVAQTELA